MADEEKEISVHIYSDVDSGDWRAEIESDEGKTELSGADQSTAIDLVAATATLSYLYEHYKGRKVKIYTKSEYLKKGITRWIKRWRHNGWLTKDNTPVLHKELWQELDELNNSLSIVWCQGKKPEDIKAELKQLHRSKKHKKNGQVNLSLLNPEICAPADAKTFVITEEWLRANTNFGAVNAKQLKAIGLSWPPKNGWLQNMVGKVISIEEKLKFERYKKNTKKTNLLLTLFVC